MKKTVFIFVLAVSCCFGAAAQSMLKVSTRDGNTPINVSVDGRYFNKRGTSVTVGELPFGRHYLKIFTLKYTRRGRGYEDVIFEGDVNTDDGMVTLFVYDPESGNADVQQQDMNTYLAAHPRPARGNWNGSNAPGGYNRNTPASPAAPAPVSTLTDDRKNDLKGQVDAKKTDTEKMNLLKDALKNDKITTNQVGDMMDWFIFETAKEDFAKWAYSITSDKQYFSDLAGKFTYKTYQDDFDKFLKDQGQ